MAEQTQGPSRRDPDAPRTGPIGRLARVAWATAAALTLTSIVDRTGSARFRNPHILTEPSAWFLHGLMLLAFVLTVGAVAAALLGHRVARRVQVASVVAIAGTVLVAGAVGAATSGAVWGFPLADLVWYFDVVVLAAQFAAFVLAVVVGTPGCELNVFPELIARVRRETTARTEGLACIIGLDQIDRWEARRR